MPSKLDTLVDEHARQIAAAAQVMIAEAYAPATKGALLHAQGASGTVDAELKDLNRRRDRREVSSADYYRSAKFLNEEKRKEAVETALALSVRPKIEEGVQQLLSRGGPVPVAPGELLSAVPLAQMLASLAPAERPALVEGVLLNYATEKKSPAAILPILRSAVEAQDLKGTGPVWSALFDLKKHAETLARTAEQVAAVAAPDVARHLQGSLKLLADGFSQPGGLEQSPQWNTGVLEVFGGPASTTEEAA